MYPVCNTAVTTSTTCHTIRLLRRPTPDERRHPKKSIYISPPAHLPRHSFRKAHEQGVPAPLTRRGGGKEGGRAYPPFRPRLPSFPLLHRLHPAFPKGKMTVKHDYSERRRADVSPPRGSELFKVVNSPRLFESGKGKIFIFVDFQQIT